MRGLIPFAAGAALALSAGWIAFPRAIYQGRPQPVDFSHKVHAEKAGTKCEDCHAFRDDGTYAGLPALDKCSSCHAVPMGNSTAEKRFIDTYVTAGREPQWLSYARQPENVFFSHAAHVKLGQLKCEQCHGALGSSDGPRPQFVDPISGYSRDVLPVVGHGMKMNDCVACHRQRGLEHSCMECHK